MSNSMMQEIVTKMTEAQKYTVFVVGDSITAGFNATDSEHTYTACFARGLAAHFPERRVSRYDGIWYPTKDHALRPLKSYEGPITVQEGTRQLTVVRSGIGGNTVRRMLDRKEDFIGKELGGSTADLYIIMVGINDALSNDPTKFVEPEIFEAHLHELLNDIEQGNPMADVILMTATYNDEKIETASCLEPYVERMRSVAETRELPLIDQHRVWMEHYRADAPNYGQGDWLSGVDGDFCHPSDRGHRAIANEMIRCMFET
jgi:lysophospholipase L1-like esterase